MTAPVNFIDADDCAATYASLDADRPGGSTLGTLDHYARDGGYSGPDDRTVEELFARIVAMEPSAEPTSPGSPYPRPKTAAELASGNFPPSEYVWKDFILQGHVNLLYGDGATGKTLAAEHMAVSVASGRELFGRPTKQMPVLLALAEDNDGETKERFEAICEKLGVDLAELPIHIWCLPGYDATLARIADDGTWQFCDFWKPLREQIGELGECFVVLDSLADIFALNESLRLPANTAIKKVLGSLCRDTGATILALAHPSKASMSDGSGYAGSTAWNNAVRNRLTLERPEAKGPKRILKVAKANYGEEASIELYLFGMNFIEVSSVEVADMEAQEREAIRAVVFDLLDKGITVVSTHGAGQKPQDVAKEVFERKGLKIDPKRVSEHLKALVRNRVLEYVPGSNAKRGQRAGYRRVGVFND